MDADRIPGGLGQRIVQLHPTLRCNLVCRHCYSTSGPDNRVSLAPDVLLGVLEDAAAMGYEVVSVSGGEPFLYPGLVKLLAHARSLGLRTTVTTNGTVLSPRRLAGIRDHLDLLAVSVDGPPGLHDRIRGAGSFDRMTEGLDRLRAASVPFGLICTVTRRSWTELVWLGRFAAEQQARLLQLHPLELTGRAERELAMDAPGDDVSARTYLMATALAAEYRGRLRVQVDLLPTEDLRQFPELVYASDLESSAIATSRPAELLSPIVVEADGTVVPVSYGFARSYRVGHVGGRGLAAAWPGYLEERYPAFRRLCRGLWEGISKGDRAVVNWHELIVECSNASAADREFQGCSAC
ncbi:MAG TPA: radical SAM/SPASM domain-containing protein [Streptosporangiaceae bacterium]|jgi:MoaA/NifB/PqqE/SkfB family radical SAM enzyme